MKPRLILPLLLCALLLAGCYRQTEESFQQVDSAVVVSQATPTSLESVIVVGEGDAAGDTAGVSTRQPYITPETAPGQVQQPTAPPVTAASIVAVTTAPIGSALIATVPPRLDAQATLDPTSPCVHIVQAGESIFRLSLSWNTTMDEVALLNDLDDVDVLSLGQLLQIPGCETPTETPAPTEIQAQESTPPPTVTPIPQPIQPESGPPIHVVSAGETLESISLRYRVDVNKLKELNSLVNPNQLSVGQELILPD